MQKSNAPKKRVNVSKPRQQKTSPVSVVFIAAVMVAAIVLGFVLQYKIFPDGLFAQAGDSPDKGKNDTRVTEIAASGSVRINEIMSSNGTAWSDENGNFGDWVELYNASDSQVDITGWMLADQLSKLNIFTFPKHVMAPGEYVIVFCDGTLRNTPGYTYHAPFALSSDGDSVVLYNAGGTAVQAVNVPALRRNNSYAFTGSSWATVAYYTPGMPNEESYYSAMRDYLTDGAEGAGEVIITELMADNATYLKTEDGMYYDWVEICNTGSAAVNLSGWSLSDDPSNTTKWRFPAVSLGAGQYMVIYCSGLDIKDPSNIMHTSFRLNAEGETVVLSNAQGLVQSTVTFENLKIDRSYGLYEGSYTKNMAPTPGYPNTAAAAAVIERQFAQANPYKLYISEVSAGLSRVEDNEGTSNDWIEIYNGSSNTIDLGGWGISDEADQPRKWQFPSGWKISPGSYTVVDLTGGKYPNFGISTVTDACETITLCTPEGTVVDRVPLLKQYASISYGRMDGSDGFFYLGKTTKGERNSNVGFALRTGKAAYSLPGGMYDGPVTLSLDAAPGATIRYSTDGSVPTSSSSVYTGPIEIGETTVIRTRVFRDGEYPSETTTQTYFIGLSHTVNVVSLVMDPVDLWSNEKGLYVKGPNALKEYPYGSINKGANFWMTWEKSGNIEYFTPGGQEILSQGCGIRLHGQYSRSEEQKAFKIIARSEYSDEDRFYAELFSKRPYDSYQSFLLRSSSQDGDKTRFRDSLLQSLAENMDLLYQETEVAVVYLNGAYWGHYNLRERINKYSIAQFEGWTDVDHIDLIKANTNVLQGSNKTYADMLAWVKSNGVKNDEALARVEKVIDMDNFIDYMCCEIFTGNTDTLNVKRYRSSTEGDGRWRWVLFDLDWAFTVDTNSMSRWITAGGMGNGLRTDNTLFVALMKNATFKDRFLTRLGELMATDFTTANIKAKVNERIAVLLPEM
ncbi:MAG: lamin tail domain-containing protein, partial [Clostridia bacterium]|nr:lamin tail domain-containing protein [Clostridia bacterium]